MTSSGSAPAIRLWTATFLGVFLAGVLGGQTITEFPVPTTPPPGHDPFTLFSIAAGPDGAVWFTEYHARKIGRITTSGDITEYPVSGDPFYITAGPDGALWFTESTGIGRISTAGQITEFNARGGSITAGPDGALWFTHETRIGRITTGGVVTEFALPGSSVASVITAGPDGALWFTEGDKIGRISTAGVIEEFAAPFSGAAITAGPDGALWFTEAGSKIGRITTAGVVTEFNVPIAGSLGEITAGPDGAIWCVDNVAQKVVRVATSGAVTGLFAIPASGELLTGITAGPDGGIWFLESSRNKVARLALPSGACRSDATTLCLDDGRFRARTQWTTPQGSSGFGQGVTLTEDSGYFWFFSDNNVELLVKVLDGCDINSRVWTFAGGLTNVQVVMTIEDTQTGAVRTYANPQGTAFQPIEDTTAFESCPSISGLRATRPARPKRAAEGDLPKGTAQESSWSPRPLEAGSELLPCYLRDEILCLNINRFKVETSWSTPDGRSGAGRAVGLTIDSGYFWFFSPENAELMVKASNACDFNSRFWVFAGGLTNVKVLMTVTDTRTGAVRTYASSQGSPFEPIQDTGAFACP